MPGLAHVALVVASWLFDEDGMNHSEGILNLAMLLILAAMLPVVIGTTHRRFRKRIHDLEDRRKQLELADPGAGTADD